MTLRQFLSLRPAEDAIGFGLVYVGNGLYMGKIVDILSTGYKADRDSGSVTMDSGGFIHGSAWDLYDLVRLKPDR